jgi:hypothetical protein
MDKKPLTEEQKEKRRKAVSKYYHNVRKHKKITDEQRIERNNNAKSKYHDKYRFQRKILYLCRRLNIDRDDYMKHQPDYITAYTELMNTKLKNDIEKEKAKQTK